MKQSEKPAAAQAIIEEMNRIALETKAKGTRFSTLTRQLAKVTAPAPAGTTGTRKNLRIVETQYGVEHRSTPDSEFTLLAGPVSKADANKLAEALNLSSSDTARVVKRGVTDWTTNGNTPVTS